MQYINKDLLSNQNDFYLNIARRLKDLRKRKGIMQEELAERVGLTKNHLSALERGINKVSLQLFFQYLDICDARIEDVFFCPNSEEEAITPTEEADNNCCNVDIDFLKKVLELPEDERKMMLSILSK